MGRKCSHCGNVGHNSRTCTAYRGAAAASDVAVGGLRIFGVHLDVSSSSSSSSIPSMMKKSFSMDCFPSSSSSSPSSSLSTTLVTIDEDHNKTSINGYLSDGLMTARTQEKKKGVAWTEEEHRTFLMGLEKLGKGDWRGISKNFVKTRTPTQVASHAQKYFLRQVSLTKKKRRSSLFDMVGSSSTTSTMAGHHRVNSSCGSKTSNHHEYMKPVTNGSHYEKIMPLVLDLTSFSHEQANQTAASSQQHQVVPIWVHGMIDFNNKQLSSKPQNAAAADDDDDLELTLATPDNKSPPPNKPHLTRPISVT
ncbi:hypothetical protein Q3G72_023527 [Acer saccharum]|nr:hypothetical protein Q3G72_023527 [Acer saccharum]